METAWEVMQVWRGYIPQRDVDKQDSLTYASVQHPQLATD